MVQISYTKERPKGMPNPSASLFGAIVHSDCFPRFAFAVKDSEGKRVFSSRYTPIFEQEAEVETLSVRGQRYELCFSQKDSGRVHELMALIEALTTTREKPPLLYADHAYRGFLSFIRHELVADATPCRDSIIGRSMLLSGDAFFSAMLIAVILCVRSGVRVSRIAATARNGYFSLSMTARVATPALLAEKEPFLFEIVKGIVEANRFAIEETSDEEGVTLTLRTYYTPDVHAVLHAPLRADDTLEDLPRYFPFCLFGALAL